MRESIVDCTLRVKSQSIVFCFRRFSLNFETICGGLTSSRWCSHLGQRSVVPNVAFVREHVGHISQFPLLDVLFDGIQRLLRCDLRYETHKIQIWDSDKTECLKINIQHYQMWCGRGLLCPKQLNYRNFKVPNLCASSPTHGSSSHKPNGWIRRGEKLQLALSVFSIIYRNDLYVNLERRVFSSASFMSLTNPNPPICSKNVIIN